MLESAQELAGSLHAPLGDNIDVEDGLHDRLPSTHATAAVSPEEPAQDESSARELQHYNSLDVAVDVSIDNRAWFPDLGSVSETNLDRLTSLMRSDGFDVVRAAPFLFAHQHAGDLG